MSEKYTSFIFIVVGVASHIETLEQICLRFLADQ